MIKLLAKKFVLVSQDANLPPEGVGELVIVDTAVIKPLPLTVKLGIVEELPQVPVFVFTVANVKAELPGPEAVPSPVKAVI